MIVEIIPVGPLQVNCIVLGCPATRKAVVIDPGADLDMIRRVLEKEDLKIELILNTHGHFDHIGGNAALKAATGVPLMIHRGDVPLLGLAATQAASFGLKVDNSPLPDRELQDGEEIVFGEQRLQVLHTPGHSPGGVCFYGAGLLVSGDTLFAGSIGRTDLPGGNHAQLLQSINEKLAGLPPQTRVLPGHGPLSQIDHELKYNPFLNG